MSMEKLTKLDRIAIGTPQNVPAGQYAKQAMENVGLYRRLEKERKLIMAKDVRQALLYAERGEVDGAFVYKTDARLATSARIIFMVPENLHERVSYPVALTLNGAKNPSAQDFYTFMTTPAAREVFIKHGFQPAE